MFFLVFFGCVFSVFSVFSCFFSVFFKGFEGGLGGFYVFAGGKWKVFRV